MALVPQRSDFFLRDFGLQYLWYLDEAGEAVADRFLAAVEETIAQLTEHPGSGRCRKFDHPELQGIRSFRVRPPFEAHLVFYRETTTDLFLVRMMDGRRDLPRRLREIPGAD
jgi:toxin ParE1/3/4